MSNKTSVVWLYFIEIGDGKVKCELCKNTFSYKSGSSSNLKKHLFRKHPTINLSERFTTDCGNPENNEAQETIVQASSSATVKITVQTGYTAKTRPAGSIVTTWLTKSSGPTEQFISSAAGAENQTSSAASGSPKQATTTDMIPVDSSGDVLIITASPPQAQPLLQPSRAKQISQANLRGYMTRPISVYRQKAITSAILRMIIVDFQAFNIVNNQGFCGLLTTIDPSYKLPSRSHFSQTLLPAYYDEVVVKVELILEEAEYVSLTTDCWTSNSTQSFMAVTAHFVSASWKPVSVLLGCFQFNERHTAENLRNLLLQLVKRWKLDRKVVSISSDTAFNIVAAVRLTGWDHVPCYAHKLNLVVEDSVKNILPILLKVRSIVGHFHRSTTATTTFADMQRTMNPKATTTPLRLILDVSTRLVQIA